MVNDLMAIDVDQDGLSIDTKKDAALKRCKGAVCILTPGQGVGLQRTTSEKRIVSRCESCNGEIRHLAACEL